MLAARSSFRLSTNEFVTAHAAFVPDIIFANTISGTAGHIRLFNASNTEIDRLGYGTASTHPLSPEGTAATAPATGKILQRILTSGSLLNVQDTDNNSTDFGSVSLTILPPSGLSEVVIPVDVCPNIDELQTVLPPGYLLDESGDCQADICANIDGLQLAVPTGYESLDGENCSLIPPENATLLITELLANAPSFDAGKEFIEIYNPNDRSISLKDYKLELGPSFSKKFTLPNEQSLASHAYISFSDVITGLVLPNSLASLRLISPAGNVVSTTDTYNQPKENESWALIDDVWQFTNQPTSAAANLPSSVIPDDPTDGDSQASLEPCGVGKERNPETNRCRTIQVAVAGLTPCKTGQERNPDTNRCRSILAAASDLVPCKAGQERNPETNRCRSVSSQTADLQPCDPGQERNPETNRCRKSTSAQGQVEGISQVKDVDSGPIAGNMHWMLAGLGVAGAVGYAGFEWRREILNRITSIKNKFIN
jgi:hypothetical protein